MLTKFICIIPFLFLTIFIINFFFGKHLPGKGAFLNILSLLFGMVLYSAGLIKTLSGTYFLPQEIDLDFLSFYYYKIGFNMRVDSLSLSMAVTAMICMLLLMIYSLRDLHGKYWEKKYNVFWALGMFALLLVILANNYLIIYVCLEILCFACYAAASSNREDGFVQVNYKNWLFVKITDLFFLVGVCLLFLDIGSLNLSQIYFHIKSGFASADRLSVIGMLFFAGIMGRLSFFPFYSWLTGLIKNAGPALGVIPVFGVVIGALAVMIKSHVIFMNAGCMMKLIALAGMTSALAGAAAACAVSDIKKFVAYAVLSQSGIMVFVYGMGFMQWTIYFFFCFALQAAVLLMAAGSTAAMFGSKNADFMGGAAKRMPFTAINFFVITLACGYFPLFSNFYVIGKVADEIFFTSSVFLKILFFLFIISTAFYISRMCFLVFFGQPRNVELFERSIDPPAVMSMPIVFGIIFLIAGGWYLGFSQVISRILESSIYAAGDVKTKITKSGLSMVQFSAAAAVLSAFFAGWYTSEKNRLSDIWGRKFPFLLYPGDIDICVNRFYETAAASITKNILRIVCFFEKEISSGAISFLKHFAFGTDSSFASGINALTCMPVLGMLNSIRRFSRRMPLLQSGRIANYILVILAVMLMFMIVEGLILREVK